MKKIFDIGFDSVECVIAIEETFRISIPNGDAERIKSVGDLCDYIARRIQLRADENEPCPTARAFYELRRRAIPDSSSGAMTVRPSTPTSALLDPGDVREAWRALSRRLDLPLPSLLPSAKAEMILTALWLASGIAAATISYTMYGFRFAIFAGIIAWFLDLIPFVLSHIWLSSHQGNRIPPAVQTAGDLTYLQLVERKKKSLGPDWTRSELCAAVRYIVARNAGLTVRQIGLDTTFTELDAISG
jgi:hypothetical protein